ncbi:MAG: alginate lyase family protein [Pirellulales bacterium]|nr:alginate lyase family protein [Pirellulales bacterium]
MIRCLMVTLVVLVGSSAVANESETGELSGVCYYEADRMQAAKAMLAERAVGPDADEVREAAEMLREEGNDALRRGPYSVMDKDVSPPSGDKHDYISYSVYWWPDPDKADGLPYIRRDGKTNHEQRAKGDRDRLEDMINDVESLALARYFLGRQQYGDHGARLVRAWFLDDATKMNPHLNFAQAVLGRSDGRNGGIIDSRAFIELLDSIVLLHATGDLSVADMDGLQAWFAEYYRWLTTSEMGRKERAAANNHGIWYSAQAARVALFVGDEATARELIEDARDKRLPAAMESDGKQPEELSRTRSLHYSLFSLDALAYLARFGESLGIDLWNHRAPNGASIRLGLNYAAPYVLDQDAWPYEQIHDYRLSPQIVQLLRMADARYSEPIYGRVLKEVRRTDRDRIYAPLLFRGPAAGTDGDVRADGSATTKRG